MRHLSINIVLALLVGILFMACDEVDTSRMSISGKLSNAEGQTVYIQQLSNSSVPDSAIVAQDGKFTITMDNPSMDFYRFFTKGAKEPVLMAFDSTHRNISIQADASDLMGTFQVTGSKDSELLQQMIVKKRIYQQQLDSVMTLQKQLPPDADPMLRNAMNMQDEKLKEEFDKEFKSWAVENSKSLAGLAIISEVDLLQAIPEYKKIRNDLQNVIPGSVYLKTMDQNIANLEKAVKQQSSVEQGQAHLSPGAIVPEITQPDPAGKMVSLSSQRGKYVLIDFWASWCGPCRRENPNVKRLYDKYGGKDFEIFSVSLDSSKERWEQAIEQDGMSWLHVSDLKKWSSAPAADYGVRSIPYTVLVDKEGKVVATNLRGPSLQAKLEELFGKK